MEWDGEGVAWLDLPLGEVDEEEEGNWLFMEVHMHT